MNTNQLRDRFRELPPISQTKTPWGLAQKEIRGLVFTHNPNEFLRWPKIATTMYAGGDYVEREYLEMVSADSWQQWLRAVKAPKFGGWRHDNFSRLGTNSNLIHQAFHLFVWQRVSGQSIKDLNKIVEFGGGYGAMCNITRNLGFSGEYVIFDLPEMLLLQQFYLENIGASNNVSFVSDGYPHEIDLFIANFSISEVPEDKRIIPYAKNYLISYQAVFESANNEKWFADFADSRHGVEWEFFRNPVVESLYYLVGKSED